MKSKACILIVDDDRSLVRIAERILQEEGFNVITAFDGMDGLQKAREEKPDLIILDIIMPRRDGYEVCRDLQSDPETMHIPVVFLSAKGGGIAVNGVSIKDQLKGFQSGALDFLAKPVSGKDLVERVKALLWLSKLGDKGKKAKDAKPRVLIIDDNCSMVKITEYALQEEGFDVITAFDGLEGLRKAREQKPDLVILDIVIPEIDGFQVLNLIRQRSKVPVIMITAERKMESVKKALFLGADDYVGKPFTTEDLLTRMRAKLTQAGLEVT